MDPRIFYSSCNTFIPIHSNFLSEKSSAIGVTPSFGASLWRIVEDSPKKGRSERYALGTKIIQASCWGA